MRKSDLLSAGEMSDLLVLIEEVHKAESQQQFRQILIHGLGSLIDSVSCVWTEFDTEVFATQKANTHVAEVSDQTINTEDLLPIFNAFAYQHPVIAHVISTGDRVSNAISDKIERDSFRKLELYRYFYAQQGVEDQMSIGFVENNQVKGLSIHRSSWGFDKREHDLVDQIASCTFSFYRTLPSATSFEAQGEPVIQVNAMDFAQHHELLGLTQRQAELLNLVTHGQSNKQIAAALSLSEGTVRKHLENCFRRLKVQNRVSAITAAISIMQESRNIEV